MSYGSMAEAVEENGLDYKVKMTPLQTLQGTDVRDFKACSLVRDGQIFEVVAVNGNRYQPYQPIEALGWLDQLLAEMPGSSIEQVGRNKATVFARVKLPVEKEVRLRGSEVGDVVGKELWVYDSYDGSSKLNYVFRNKRLICSNGIASIFNVGSYSLSHVGSTSQKMHDLKSRINLVTQGFDEELLEFQRWQDTGVNADTAELAYAKVLTGSDWEGANTRVREYYSGKAPKVRNLDKLMGYYNHAPGARPGSVWGWFNGLTYHLTHFHGRSSTARATNWIKGRGKQLDLAGIETARELARL